MRLKRGDYYKDNALLNENLKEVSYSRYLDWRFVTEKTYTRDGLLEDILSGVALGRIEKHVAVQVLALMQGDPALLMHASNPVWNVVNEVFYDTNWKLYVDQKKFGSISTGSSFKILKALEKIIEVYFQKKSQLLLNSLS